MAATTVRLTRKGTVITDTIAIDVYQEAAKRTNPVDGTVFIRGIQYDSASAEIVASAESAIKIPVKAATTGALPAYTVNGTIYTANANGALPVQDAVALIVGDDFAVKNEADQTKNGIFTVTNGGSEATPWIITRRTDFDEEAEIKDGALVVVREGTENGQSIREVDTATPYVPGVSIITFPLARVVDFATQTEAFTGSPASKVANVSANIPGFDIAIAAAGATQATAAQLTKQVNNVTTAGPGRGVKMMAGVAAGQYVKINSDTANTEEILIYPAAGGNLGLGIDAPVPIQPKEAIVFTSADTATNTWGFETFVNRDNPQRIEGQKAFSLPIRRSATDRIAAAGVTQVTAKPLVRELNTVGTVAAGVDDGVILMNALSGLKILVINNNGGGDVLQIYPAVGENFAGFGVNAPVAIADGTSFTVVCTADGHWLIL